MPKHKPIRFKDPGFSKEIKERLEKFIKHYPIASSAAQVLLASIAIGGVLTLASIAPGAFSVLARSLASKKRAKNERYRKLWQNFHRLKQSRALAYKGEINGEQVYELTAAGKTKIHRFLLDTLEISKPKIWDGKWKVVIFDIPERYRHARQALKNKLSELGFYQLQKSVWAHPFPCETEIEFLKNHFNIKPYVHILHVNEMPSGKVIYHFKDILKKTI